MSKHTYADSTLKSWTKDELIHQIRILEHNVAVGDERLNNQAKLLEAWAPVVHGEWLNTDGDYTSAACSICKTEYEVATEEEAEKGLWDAFICSYRYCPNCGAKMDGKERQNNE